MISAVLCVFVGFGPLSWEESLTDFSETQAGRTGAMETGGSSDVGCVLFSAWLLAGHILLPERFRQTQSTLRGEGKVTGVSLCIKKVWGFVPV